MQPHSLKKNISQFSGYVWVENEVLMFYAHPLDQFCIFCWVFLDIHAVQYYCNAHSYYSFYICLQQEKHRARVKEKIDKCVKEKLMDFCDLLNIPVKGTTKKVNIARNVLYIA